MAHRVLEGYVGRPHGRQNHLKRRIISFLDSNFNGGHLIGYIAKEPKRRDGGDEEDEEDAADGPIDEGTIKYIQPTYAFVRDTCYQQIVKIVKEVFNGEVEKIGMKPELWEDCKTNAWIIISEWIKNRRKCSFDAAKRLNAEMGYTIPVEDTKKKPRGGKKVPQNQPPFLKNEDMKLKISEESKDLIKFEDWAPDEA